MLDKFINKRSRSRKGMRTYEKDVVLRDQYMLTDYIETGVADIFESMKMHLDIDQDFRQWQLLSGELGQPAGLGSWLAELNYIENGALPPELMLRSAAYGYFLAAIDYNQLYTFKKTSSVVRPMWPPYKAFQLLPLLLAGLHAEAKELYHANATAHREGWIIRSHGFIGDFWVLLYGRYLGVIEPPFVAEIQVTLRKTAPFPYGDFLDNWDSADEREVCTMLQTLCDHQVEQAAIGGKKCFFEFNGSPYSYVPLTALMLMTLRALRGLANPQFSHPGFGNITALFEQVSTAFSDYVATAGIQRIEDAADEMLTKTLARMKSQDFDAHAIFAKQP